MKGERERIAGIQKYNTTAYRAFAAKEIDAAILDGQTTGKDLAATILDLQAERLKKVRSNREEDNEDLEEVVEPDAPPEAEVEARARHRAGGRAIDTRAVYDRLNNRAQQGGK